MIVNYCLNYAYNKPRQEYSFAHIGGGDTPVFLMRKCHNIVVKVIVDKKWYNTYIGKFFYFICIKDKKM